MSRMTVSASFFTKVPLIKYTPDSIVTADPNPSAPEFVGFTLPVIPTMRVGEPGELVSKVSPSANVDLELFVPLLSYFTKIVAESESVSAVALITVAVTPELLPVTSLPI